MQNQSASLLDVASGVTECLERLAVRKQQLRPLATYRLQLNHTFRLADAIRLLDYLDDLGISTFYCSPILKARTGSMHGYDITDHNALNPEIGSRQELDELASQLRERNMGLLLDIVPNHMGVGYGSNPWWQDVLQNGRSSRFAHFFDIDWNPLKAELRNKVLLPVLGNQYGEELESGKLAVKHVNGRFQIEYYDKVFPLDPQTIPLIFEAAGDFGAVGGEDAARELMSVLVGFAELPPHSTVEGERVLARQRETPFLEQRLRELLERRPELNRLVDEALRRVNGRPADARSFDALHKLLEAQAYRLAHWRVSAEEINYRRFFDINDLVGVRIEDPHVFASTSPLVRELLASGIVTGLRIDHPDGLFNPPQFFTRLQMLYAASQCHGSQPRPPHGENGIELDVQNLFSQEIGAARAPLYVAVEKILESGEELPKNWPVDGTVGYEFTNLVNGIFVDTRNRKDFTNFYQRFLGRWIDVETVIYESKKLIMHSSLSSELNVLSHMLDEISSFDRRARDFTRSVLRDAIRETIACLPVYRTYIDERGSISERDRTHISEAIALAKRRNGGMPQMVFEFLRDILLLRSGDGLGTPIYGYRRQLYFTLKFQQLTGPVMAKGLEDTACYVYNRFVSMNEVGGSPKEFGIELDEFHRGNLQRQQSWPYSMLTTSTHDTKRSEDIRMRLDVLSELPRLWAAQVLRWRRSNRLRKRSLGDGRVVPDPNEEYLLYQTLLGAWPLPDASRPMQGVHGENGNASRPKNGHGAAGWSLDREQRQEFITRIQAYMNKAVHEAKVNMSWINPHPEYTEALNTFIARILAPGSETRPNAFLRQMEGFLPKIALFGVVNSLAQVLIKLTAPGVPDIYQGQELLDFSLVDPDNRRPVDFALRRRYLAELRERSRDRSALRSLCGEMLRDWSDGRLKLWVSYGALAARREYRQLFQTGSYTPLKAGGRYQRHVVAFARSAGERTAITVTPRFAYTLMNGEERMPVGNAWGDAELVLPPAANRRVTNLLTGEVLETGPQHTLLCREVFRLLPVGLLLR